MRSLWLVAIAACGRIGFDANGPTGDGATGSGDAPGTGVDGTLATPPSSARTFTAGLGHACIIEGATMWCWGFDQEGQVAGSIGGNVTSPRVVTGTSWATVATGELGTCAITTGGDVACWGSNFSGEQGTAMTMGSTSTPTAITGAGLWKEITLRRYSACGIQTDGSLWCWGQNNFGQNGQGDSGTNRWAPTRVGTRTDWATVSMSSDSACAATTGGAAYCWGRNDYGTLGTGDITAHTSPVPVAGEHQFIKLVAGKEHQCALDVQGALWCWGHDNLYQLGFADKMDRNVPTRVDENTYLDLAPGWFHTCAIRSDHSLWCWGDNNQGAFGSPSPETATQVQIPGTWSSVTAGEDYECMYDTTSELWCMGNNPYGQLGQGNMAPATAPVSVFLP